MIRSSSVAAVCLFVAIGALPPAAQAIDVYSVDSSHTSVTFGVSHNGLSVVYGFFRKAQGSYSLDPNPANCRFWFDIDATSIDTNLKGRDDHLKSAEFFDVARHPQMTFRSTSCRAERTEEGLNVYYVTGDLIIHGVKQQVTLPLQMLAERDGVDVKTDGVKDHRTGFLCYYQLKRSDYGMNTIPIVGNAVSITISFEGVQQRNTATAMRP